MTNDITDLVQRYRMALRHIWNSCIWIDPGLRNWESVYSFRELKLPLFRTLVADPLGFEAKTLFGREFQIFPQPRGDGKFKMLQVNVSTPSQPDAGVWIPLHGSFSAEDVSLTLVDLFDWAPLEYIDLHYYVVLIEQFPQHPDKVGHHALVEANHVAVVWSPCSDRHSRDNPDATNDA